MKILFICCCLEPGMDGVGDYTRRLATELLAQGHSCWLLSLADPRVKKATAGDFEGMPVLRLPATDAWTERVRRAKSFCESVAPDWVSWQIVPYGFDPRGLSFGLGARCREISGNCRNQIMFHEIWIGEAEQSSLKNKVVGKVQRFIIQDFIRRLRPPVVHTHTPLYRHLLERLGVATTILPLFGNIPLTTRPDPEWLEKKWPEGRAPFQETERDSWWIFVLFGTIHPEWEADDFQQRSMTAAQQAGKKCLLISIGQPGGAGERMLQRFQEQQNESWRFVQLGRQAEEAISQCLLAADFGVSSVPPEYVFKSGTAAAMVEHGLPVITTRPTLRYTHCPPEILAVGMRNVVRDFNLETLKKSKTGSVLPAVAGQFIRDLENARAVAS